MTKEEIDAKYTGQANELEAEYFDIIDSGLPSQQRQLKVDKSIEEFNLRHGEIWHNHEAELIAEGYLKPPEPMRDLEAEIDDLKARIQKLEEKWAIPTSGSGAKLGEDLGHTSGETFTTRRSG